MDLWPIELRDPVFLIPKLLMYDVCLSFKRLTIRHLFAKMEPGAEFQNVSQVRTIKYEGRRDIHNYHDDWVSFKLVGNLEGMKKIEKVRLYICSPDFQLIARRS